MQNGDISSTEFDKVLQELEKYLKIKANIRNQAKTKERQISQKQQEELLEQDFLRKIANTSDIQCVNTI